MVQLAIRDNEQGSDNSQSYYDYTKKQATPRNMIILFVIFAGIMAFHFRHKIAAAHDRWRTQRRMGYVHLGLNFQGDLESGLNSENFDIGSNISANDPRQGLLEEGKKKVKELMSKRGMSFDEARLEYTRTLLAENNIDANGMPLDPRTITFGR